MGDSNSTNGRSRDRLRRLGSGAVELAWFLAIVTLWTVGLALFFLAVAWPRWVFYTALLGGVFVFAYLGSRDRE